MKRGCEVKTSHLFTFILNGEEKYSGTQAQKTFPSLTKNDNKSSASLGYQQILRKK